MEDDGFYRGERNLERVGLPQDQTKGDYEFGEASIITIQSLQEH